MLQDCFWNSISPPPTTINSPSTQLLQVASLASATSPSFTYVSNLVPGQLSVQSCCSPIASASAAAPRLRPLPLPARYLHLLQLLFAACVCFSCCSTIASGFDCCSPIVSVSTAAPRLRPLTAAPLLCPASTAARANCVRFDCCSPIACIRLQPQLDSSPCPHPGPMFSNILSRSSRFSNLKHEGRASLV